MAEGTGSLLLKAFLGLCLAGLALAALLPALHASGVEPPEWLVLPVGVGVLALVLGPALRARWRTRRQR